MGAKLNFKKYSYNHILCWNQLNFFFSSHEILFHSTTNNSQFDKTIFSLKEKQSLHIDNSKFHSNNGDDDANDKTTPIYIEYLIILPIL